MCDKISETSDKFETSRELVQDDGCLDANARLSRCLADHGHDWRACKEHTDRLRECFRQSKERKEGDT